MVKLATIRYVYIQNSLLTNCSLYMRLETRKHLHNCSLWNIFSNSGLWFLQRVQWTLCQRASWLRSCVRFRRCYKWNRSQYPRENMHHTPCTDVLRDREISNTFCGTKCQNTNIKSNLQNQLSRSRDLFARRSWSCMQTDHECRK
jgi:hypothetical protein